MKRNSVLTILLLAALLIGFRVTAGAAAGVKYAVTAPYANLLPAPDAEKRPVAVLAKGDVISARQTENGFVKATLPSAGLTGWVALTDLTKLDAAKNTEGVTGIYVKKLPDKTAYIEGEEAFDPTGLQIRAKYKNKAETAVKGYTLYLPSFSAYGKKEVQVRWAAPGGTVFTTKFTVTVKKVPLKALQIVSPPAKTAYIEGEKLDLAGLQLRAVYADGRPSVTFAANSVLKDAAFTLKGCHNEAQGKALTLGEHKLEIAYKYPEISCTLSLTARQKTLVELSVKTPPKSLVTYSNKKTPDLTGLTLAARYDNGVTETVPLGKCAVKCTPSKFVLGPGNPVYVSFGGKRVTLQFTYALDDANAVSVLLPGPHNFILGEKIDLRGLKVYKHSVSGAKTEVHDYKLGKIDPKRTGPQTVTVKYGQYSALLTLNISPYYQRGDVDGTGEVTAEDARQALRAADADANGSVTAEDARLILRTAVGLQTLLDFENVVLLPNLK